MQVIGIDKIFNNILRENSSNQGKDTPIQMQVAQNIRQTGLEKIGPTTYYS